VRLIRGGGATAGPQPEPPGPREAPAIGLPAAILRERVSWRRLAGRAVLTWLVAYLALRDSMTPFGDTFEDAVLITVIWLPFLQWATEVSRTMPFALGTYAASTVASCGAFVTTSAIAFWFPGLLHLTVGRLAVIAVVTTAVSATWDVYVRRAARVPMTVLIVGGGHSSSELVEELSSGRHERFHLLGVVDDAPAPGVGPVVGGGLADLRRIVATSRPDIVVVAAQRDRPEVFRQLLDVAASGFSVVGLPDFYEFAFGRLPVRELTPVWFMSVLHLYQRPYGRLAKRLFDLLVASVGLLVTLPVLPVAVAIVGSSGGPLFYRQLRLGAHGRPFWILKFRSMQVGAEQPGVARWAEANDPRVIRGGRFLRLTRIDELPQLWNVLNGDMSIVGPRPERPEFVEELEAEVPFWDRRHLVKPGITGWAQIRSGYAADTLGTEEKLSYDLWYLRHRSLLLDIVICLKTVPRVVTGWGAR
jgi:exopolysaccharide biosynthesis polyprenyl glycosylphosphotransferase